MFGFHLAPKWPYKFEFLNYQESFSLPQKKSSKHEVVRQVHEMSTKSFTSLLQKSQDFACMFADCGVHQLGHGTLHGKPGASCPRDRHPLGSTETFFQPTLGRSR